MLSKLIAALVVYTVAVVLGLAVLIYGWGLSPVSWSWIVGGFLGQTLLYVILDAIRREP